MPYAEMNLKWMIDLNLRFKALKHLEKVEKCIFDLGLASVS